MSRLETIAKMKTIIVLPTYNERENIQILVKDIFTEVDTKIFDLNLLFVDDNSPDGTQDEIKNLIKQDEYKNRIFLLSREKKEGLGRAYVAGFTEALRMGAEIIFEMDSDMSHKPIYIPAMIKEITEQDKDISIGSRRVKDGGVENWGFHRKLVSWGANTFTHVLLRLKTKDCTSGFRAFKCDTTLKRINMDDILTNGYAFQLELIYACERNLGASIGEVPIIFPDREKGESKLGFKDILEFFGYVLKLFIKGTKIGKEDKKV